MDNIIYRATDEYKGKSPAGFSWIISSVHTRPELHSNNEVPSLPNYILRYRFLLCLCYPNRRKPITNSKCWNLCSAMARNWKLTFISYQQISRDISLSEANVKREIVIASLEGRSEDLKVSLLSAWLPFNNPHKLLKVSRAHMRLRRRWTQWGR